MTRDTPHLQKVQSNKENGICFPNKLLCSEMAWNNKTKQYGEAIWRTVNKKNKKKLLKQAISIRQVELK